MSFSVNLGYLISYLNQKWPNLIESASIPNLKDLSQIEKLNLDMNSQYISCSVTVNNVKVDYFQDIDNNLYLSVLNHSDPNLMKIEITCKYWLLVSTIQNRPIFIATPVIENSENQQNQNFSVPKFNKQKISIHDFENRQKYQNLLDILTIIIGDSIYKAKTYVQTMYHIKQLKVPCQFMHSGQLVKLDGTQFLDIDTASDLIRTHNLKVYIHAPFTINFCNPFPKSNPNNSGYVKSVVKSNLEIGRQLGVKGVVFHTGSATRFNKEESMQMMENMVREAINYASVESPMLLETPVGEGNEVCFMMEEFYAFYCRFKNDWHRLKICIDSCHVWGAGYDPMEYILGWSQIVGKESIQLIHFNDSKGVRNDRKDRHEYPGNGCIGLDKMSQIAAWCWNNEIDMVKE